VYQRNSDAASNVCFGIGHLECKISIVVWLKGLSPTYYNTTTGHANSFWKGKLFHKPHMLEITWKTWCRKFWKNSVWPKSWNVHDFMKLLIWAQGRSRSCRKWVGFRVFIRDKTCSPDQWFTNGDTKSCLFFFPYAHHLESPDFLQIRHWVLLLLLLLLLLLQSFCIQAWVLDQQFWSWVLPPIFIEVWG
jgi:hypothetical protein